MNILLVLIKGCKMIPNSPSFRGHTMIRVVGSALIPIRFWSVKVLTDKEYNSLDYNTSKYFRPIQESDDRLLTLHFGE